jgi:hypothetical protein
MGLVQRQVAVKIPANPDVTELKVAVMRPHIIRGAIAPG